MRQHLVPYASLVLLSILLCSCTDSNNPEKPQGKPNTAPRPGEQNETFFNHHYALDLAGIDYSIVAGDDIDGWAKSLASRTGHMGDVHLFALANHHPKRIDGEHAGTAFLKTGSAKRVLVQQANGQSVLIDIEQKKIGTMGTGGTTLHPHPNGKFIVLLNPIGNHALGVPLSDKDKTGEAPPIFNGGKAYWSWGDLNLSAP